MRKTTKYYQNDMNSGELGIWFLHSLAAICHREENASHQIMKNKTKYVKVFHLCA